MAEILSPCRCNSRIVITSSSSTTDTPTTDLQGDMVGDRQDGAATAAPSDKKLGKITSTKVGSIYPTLTNWTARSSGNLDTGSRAGIGAGSDR
ncbi:hypothetical protein [Burkholderia pseudomallei]|uniref:hypothetical protein n=1 Tax=Burkholderia pseudomallei TaxID=28450 RepID=UPI0040643D7D